MNKILSIVVPTYNMEQYLGQCLTSLILPSKELREQLEVLVINDGSKDKSLSIMRKYEDEYPETFHVIDKENGGHGSCWNVGLKEAQGKYITFLDSDDWFDTRNLTEVISYLAASNVDGVMTKCKTHQFNGEIEENTYIYGAEDFARLEHEKIYDVATFNFNSYDTTIFSFQRFIYKTDIYRASGCKFMENTSYDDNLAELVFLCIASNFAFLDIVLYEYRLGREGQSVGFKFDLKRLNQHYNTTEQLYSFYDKYSHTNCINANIKDYIIRFIGQVVVSLYVRGIDLDIKDYKDFIFRLRREYSKYALYTDTMTWADKFYTKEPTIIYKSLRRKRLYNLYIHKFSQTRIGRLLRLVKSKVR